MHYLRSSSFFIVGLILLSLSPTSIQRNTLLHVAAPNEIQADSITNVSADTIRIRISSVGDIMAHQTQLTAQLQDDGTYDFNNNFNYMKELFGSVDVMIGNLETTFAGAKKGYSAYPRFNTPDALAAAIKKSGINLVATANNHTYDNGGESMLRTLEVLHDQGLETIGTQKTVEEKKYVIRSVKGVKIGFAAYTYESGKSPEGRKTINGIEVSNQYEELLNSFDPYEPAADLKKMQGVARQMREEGAEFVVFVVHWGKEYMQKPSTNQVEVAEALNKAGVDVIFGSHPHVVQPIDVLVDDSSRHETVVAYSMGNFISNQRYESVQNYATEDGLFIGVELEKIAEGKPRLKEIFYEPTWVNRYKKEGRYYFEVVPARLATKNNETYNIVDETMKKRVEASSERTIQLIEKPLSPETALQLSRYLKSHQQVASE